MYSDFLSKSVYLEFKEGCFSTNGADVNTIREPSLCTIMQALRFSKLNWIELNYSIPMCTKLASVKITTTLSDHHFVLLNAFVILWINLILWRFFIVPNEVLQTIRGVNEQSL